MSDTDVIGEAAARQSEAPAQAVRARVKWFNHGKGFGFVAPFDGSPDAFLHASVLQAFGLAHLTEGSEVACEIDDAAGKGPQVARLLEVIPPAGSEAVELSGTVKWFAPEKGFGFVLADDKGRDVFVHKSVLRRSGLEALAERQRVRVKATATPKGREAVWIELI